MKIVSFNINSIRARPHQLIHLRNTIDPDVIGIQETKVNDPEFPIEEIRRDWIPPRILGSKRSLWSSYSKQEKTFRCTKRFYWRYKR